MTKKRLKAAERREVIIRDAKVLFARDGLDGVSVDNIADQVGVSPAVLYKHFKSKDELYKAVLKDIENQRDSYVDAVLNSSDEFSSILETMTKVYIDYVSKDSTYLQMEMHCMLKDREKALKISDARWKCIKSAIVNFVVESEGCVAVDPEFASLMYKGMVRELLYSILILKKSMYVNADINDLVKQLVGMFLRAIEYSDLKHKNL